jgi:hypothetical protein
LYVGLSNGDLQIYDNYSKFGDDKTIKSFNDTKNQPNYSLHKNVTKDSSSIEQIILISDPAKLILAIKSSTKLFIYELVGNHINLLYTFADELPTDMVYVEIDSKRLLIFDSRKKIVINEITNKTRNIIQVDKYKEISVKERTKKLFIFNKSLIVGLSEEFVRINLVDFSIVNLSSGIPTTFSYFKKYSGNWIFSIYNDDLLLIKDTQVLVSSNDSVTVSSIAFEKIPLNIQYIYPNYLLLLYPKKIQIIDLHGDVIQTFAFTTVGTPSVSIENGIVFVTAGSVIFQFKVTQYQAQIHQFLSISGKFSFTPNTGSKNPKNDLKIIGLQKAINLINSLPEDDQYFQTNDKKQLVLRDFYKKKAIIYFELYSKYNIALVHIGSEWILSYRDILPLFPDFLNGQVQIESGDDKDSVKTAKSYSKIKQVSVKDINSVIANSDVDVDERKTLKSMKSFDLSKIEKKPQIMQKFNKAVNCLIVYLTEQRRIHHNLLKGSFKWKGIEITPSDIYPLVTKENMTKTMEFIGTIIDTTLFLCYFYCKPMLLGPLLRLPNNSCNAQVVNRCLLLNHEKVQPIFIEELLDFYYGRYLHKDALEMLYKLSHHEKKNGSPAVDEYITPELTIQYMRKLSNDYLDLIFQFSYWVIIENDEQSEKYTRQIFMNDSYECESYDNVRVVDFLIHVLKREILGIIYVEWLLFESDLQDTLEKKSLVGIFRTQLGLMYLKRLKHDRKVMDTETFIQSKYYIKLYQFLDKYEIHEPLKLLKNMPITDDAFLRFTIFIYRRLEEHEKSIDVLFNQLDDLMSAIDYCCEIYDSKPIVGTNLLHKLLDDILMTENPIESTRILLSGHGSKMDILRVLTSLPSSFPLYTLGVYLQQNLIKQQEALHDSRLKANLINVSNIKVQAQVLESKNYGYPIESMNQACPTCGKKLGYSIYSVEQDGQVIHYGCRQTQ